MFAISKIQRHPLCLTTKYNVSKACLIVLLPGVEQTGFMEPRQYSLWHCISRDVAYDNFDLESVPKVGHRQR